MRAILKLIAVAAVIALFGTADWIADSIELPRTIVFAVGGGLLVVLPFAIRGIDRRAMIAAARPTEVAFAKAATTLDVIPLPRPGNEDDIEGKTVRAPISHEEAYEMHARYAPYFDQQSALARYQAEHGTVDEERPVVSEIDPPSTPTFDQHRYAQALQYADAFEEQLTARRRTAAYEVAQPPRMARGSYTPQQYRWSDRAVRRASTQDWDAKTLVGVRPVKPAK